MKPKFKIVKSGQFNWKPEVVPHIASMGSFRFSDIDNDGKEIYQVQHGWVTIFLQIFWLKWILTIDLSHDTESFGNPQKYKIYVDPDNGTEKVDYTKNLEYWKDTFM